MDLLKIIKELKAERDRIDELIAAVKLFATRGGKRRGRPPKWLALAKERDRLQRRAGPKDKVDPEDHEVPQ